MIIFKSTITPTRWVGCKKCESIFKKTGSFCMNNYFANVSNRDEKKSANEIEK